MYVAAQQIATQAQPDGFFLIMQIVSDFYSTGIDDHLPVFLLLIIVVADILLGVARAWAKHEFSSSKFRKGLVGHVAMIVIVAFSYPFALHMHLASAIDSFIMAMLFAYGASILANLSALGVQIPYLDRYIRANIDKDKFDLKETENDK